MKQLATKAVATMHQNAKIFSYVTQNENNKQLQQDLNKFKEWMDTWLLSLNVDKYRCV